MTAPQRLIVQTPEKAMHVLSTGDAICSIVGPTGSGKTRLALEMANRLGKDKTLLVSVDSVALYRELNVGSAKPMGAEREGYHWIGLDHLHVSEVATSSQYVEQVLPVILKEFVKKTFIILVGGSHFYEQALCVGRMPGDASEPAYQKSLQPISSSELHKRLVAIDARFADKINVADRYRITRYLDLAERQGLTLDELSSPRDQRPWTTICTLATYADEDLDKRTAGLRIRTESMFEQGWVREVSDLLDSGVDPSAPGLQTVGYRDVVLYLRKVISFGEMYDRVLLAHRQLAKVQRTWVRGLVKKSNALNQDNALE